VSARVEGALCGLARTWGCDAWRGGHGARGGEVAPPRGCSPRGRGQPVHSLNNGGGSGVSATTDSALGAERRARCARRRRPTGRRGRCRVGAATGAHGPARRAGQTFVWRGRSGRRKVFGRQVRPAERHRAHTHPCLPPVHVSTCRPLRTRPPAPCGPLPKPGSRDQPDSRSELHPLTGKGKEVSGGG
jgi:hypothetical protein